MKAITIWQPYAELLARGVKEYETRSWPTSHRGIILIHAAKKNDSKIQMLSEDLSDKLRNNTRARAAVLRNHDYGSIVGYANLIDCIKMDRELVRNISADERVMGDWRSGRYAWKMSEPVLLKKPIPIKGNQGLWNYDITEQELKDLSQFI